MKIVPSEFSNFAWDCFLFSKEIAYQNYQQNVDSDNLFFSLLKKNNITIQILKENNADIERIEKEIISSLKAKAKMKTKQVNLYIGDSLEMIFSKAKESYMSDEGH